MVRDAKMDAQNSKCFFALEIEFNKRGLEYKRDEIMKKFVKHPYMVRFLKGKLSKNMAEVIDLLLSGEADKLEEKATKGLRQSNHSTINTIRQICN